MDSGSTTDSENEPRLPTLGSLSLPSAISQRQPTVMVTGSSSGIGRAIGLEMAQQGWRVILHGRTESTALKNVAAEIQHRDGDCLICCHDFADSHSLESFVQGVWNLAGGIDAWINNAGGDVLTGTHAQWSLLEKMEYLFRVDMAATLLLSQCVGRLMVDEAKRQSAMNQTDNSKSKLSESAKVETISPTLHPTAGHYSILNIGWDQAWQGMAGESGELFAMTKGAIMSLSLSLAQTLAPNVRVNCLAPGWIKTDWGNQTSDYWSHRAQRESLMQRWGTPQDIAAAVSFLSSHQANFISGQVIPINGGFRYAL